MTQYPSERLLLPTECDGAKSTNLVFTARSFTANIYIDSFSVTVDKVLSTAMSGPTTTSTTTSAPAATAMSLAERLNTLSAAHVAKEVMVKGTSSVTLHGANRGDGGVPNPGTLSLEQKDDGNTIDMDVYESMYITTGTKRMDSVDLDDGNEVDNDSVPSSRIEAESEGMVESAESESEGIAEEESSVRTTDNGLVDLLFDNGPATDKMAGWMQLEWSLRNWWMLYLSVFVIGIMIGSVAILLVLFCLKCNGKIDVSVREKWVAFTCVFAMGIVVGSALIAATIAFVFKLL